MAMTYKERCLVIKLIDQAAATCAKHGMILGNGGDISAMLSTISSELSNGDAKECKELAEAL